MTTNLIEVAGIAVSPHHYIDGQRVAGETSFELHSPIDQRLLGHIAQGSPAQVDAAIQANLKETVTRVLASLTPREERVLRMRFGIGMNTDHTLEEVGQQFSVTRERIRQIEAKALRKLKHPSRSRKMRSFLDQ